VAYREVNIWADEDAAAFVRSVARGNETVPTVMVGDVSLVNPSTRQVLAALDPAASHSARRAWPFGRFTVDRAGRPRSPR
jgi:mycoredoxin